MGNALAGRGASFFARLVMRFSLARLASDLDLFAAASLAARSAALVAEAPMSCGASLSPKAAATWPR